MKTEKVIAKETFTTEDIRLLKNQNYDVLVCNEFTSAVPLPPDMRLVLSDLYRVEGTWETYSHNSSAVDRLWIWKPAAFRCKGYNIKAAVSKLVYWTNYKTGSVKSCLKANFRNAEVTDYSSFNNSTKLKGIVKYLYKFVRQYIESFQYKEIDMIKEIPKARIGIIVNDAFELELYSQLIRELSANELIVFHYGNISKEKLNFENVIFYNLLPFASKPKPVWINPIRLDKDELHVCNTLLNEWFNITTEIKRYQIIQRTGIRQLIVNEGENRPLRNLLKPVFGDNIMVYNTMNGSKAGEAQDKDVNFDKWLLWDEEMKQMFVQKCQMPETMFEVVGHLAQDLKGSYKFENRLNLDLEYLKGKKVVSIISVRGNRKEKTDLKILIDNCLKTRDDLFFILKPHPLENPRDYLYKTSVPGKLFLVPDTFKNNKDALYDVLTLSDLCLVFGSTVALECTWFETPCITIEYRQEPLIFVNGSSIRHFSKLEDMEREFGNLDKKPIWNPQANDKSVSEKIADLIRSGTTKDDKKLNLDDMIYARNLLRKKDYDLARSKGVKKFLFNEIDFLYTENEQVEFYNCTQNRVKSTWMTWQENDRVVEKFKLKAPQLFAYDHTDLTLAIKKAMFWSNFKTGFLWYTYRNVFPDRPIYGMDSMHRASTISTLLKFARHKMSGNKPPKKFEQKPDAGLKVIHIKNDFQLGLYNILLSEIKDRDDYLVMVDNRVDKQLVQALNLRHFKYIEPLNGRFDMPFVNFYDFDKDDWYVFNIILIHWDEICETLNTAFAIKAENPDILLMNEGENGIYGAVLSEVMNANDTMVFNTMNGIKSGESQDTYINFDKWFIWDNQMKRLLMDWNGLDESKLIISGHLMEDMVRQHRYKNSLQVDLEKLKDKKVISLFSVRGRRFVKMETLQFLFDLINRDQNYFLIMRPHPAEKKEDYDIPELKHDNFLLVEYGKHELRDTLHDQLSLSNLSIVFGSTVALDSKWMGVPVISYERRDDSLVYCVDNEMIFHVRSIKELETRMYELMKFKHDKKHSEKPTVASIIIETLDRYAARKSKRS